MSRSIHFLNPSSSNKLLWTTSPNMNSLSVPGSRQPQVTNSLSPTASMKKYDSQIAACSPFTYLSVYKCKNSQPLTYRWLLQGNCVTECEVPHNPKKSDLSVKFCMTAGVLWLLLTQWLQWTEVLCVTLTWVSLQLTRCTDKQPKLIWWPNWNWIMFTAHIGLLIPREPQHRQVSLIKPSA